MNLSLFATDICVLRRHARLGNAVLLAMALAAPVAAQQPEPSPPTIYGFSLGYAPNGAIVTARDSVNGNWSYTYDPVNRLATAGRPGPALTFDYDRNGNRWRQTPLDGQGSLPQYDFDTRSNHIVGMTYDALGNIRNDGLHTYTYDAENRLIKVDEGTTAEYTYDAFGRRVRKASANGAATEYLYDLAGRVAAERDGSTGSWNRAEVYAGGRHVATYARDTTYFHHQDWLGSNRATTLPDASLAEQCTNLPFGERQICSEASGHAATATPFADYERDRETNLDHTWFRQYSSTEGRWTTPDPYLGSLDLSTPQSLNRYTYVLNRPIDMSDPLGLDTQLSWRGNCLYRFTTTTTYKDTPRGGELTETGHEEVVFCDPDKGRGADSGREGRGQSGRTSPRRLLPLGELSKGLTPRIACIAKAIADRRDSLLGVTADAAGTLKYGSAGAGTGAPLAGKAAPRAFAAGETGVLFAAAARVAARLPRIEAAYQRELSACEGVH